MKLRYLLPLAGVFCTCLSTYAQPSPARQAVSYTHLTLPTIHLV